MTINTKAIRARAERALSYRESDLDPGAREGALADVVEDDVPALLDALEKAEARSSVLERIAGSAIEEFDDARGYAPDWASEKYGYDETSKRLRAEFDDVAHWPLIRRG